MQTQAQRVLQKPVKPAPKGCAGCMLCAAGRIAAPQQVKISAGRTLGPRSLLARCVGG
jgi:hypothetical protein